MGIFDSIFNAAYNSYNAQKQYEYQRALNQQAYDLTQQGYRESFGNQRKGLESAGYNPILAVQNGLNLASYSGGSASGYTGNPASDLSSDVTNAYKTFHQQELKNTAEIDNLNSASKLSQEQANTERSKQENYEFQNRMLDVQKHLADKDLSTYDRRFYSQLYEQFQRAESYRAEASVAQYNAHTGRMNAEANRLRAKGDYYYNTHRSLGKSKSNSYSGKGFGFGGSYSSSETY